MAKTGKARSKSKSTAKTAPRRSSARKGRRWSRRVTEQSDALDLEGGVFAQRSPKKIAASLRRSALGSSRRKSNAYRSALSMLTFYINRAGRKLPAARKHVLDQAKDELRVQFGRD